MRSIWKLPTVWSDFSPFDKGDSADDNRGVLAELIDEFGRECVRRIAAGDCLSDSEARAFAALLEARERSGRRLLGAMAGPDASIDTVSGRCGLPPRFQELR
jgi:hypothetical protein